MKYSQFQLEQSPSEKKPLLVLVTEESDSGQIQAQSSLWKACGFVGLLLGLLFLAAVFFWKIHFTTHLVAHTLRATYNNTIILELDVQVEIDQGTLQGKRLISRAGREYLAFLSIPYAQPPIGDLRFQPPVAAEPWEGIRDATYFRDGCIEKERVGNAKLEDQPDITVGSEDCLYLTVYTPKEVEQLSNRRNRFPVMFYIHGGAGGAFGQGMQYGADYFMDENVILITVEYRLGVLGNLNTNTKSASGNQGLKDQLMALQWVQDNIQAFGGDQSKVTIFGNSFGGIQVTTHLMSPLGKGLYHRAIVQSGSILYPGFFTADPLHDATRLGELIGCPSAQINTEELTACLKNATAADLVLQALELKHKFNYVFTISTDTASDPDDVFLPIGPLESLQTGKLKSIPFLTGIVNSEGIKESLEVLTDPPLLEEFRKNWTDILVPYLYLQHTTQNPERQRDMSLAIRKFYLGIPENVTETGLGNNLHDFTDMYTDRMYSHPAATFLSSFRTKYNESATTNNGGFNSFFSRRSNPSKAYFYQFTKEVQTSRVDNLKEIYYNGTHNDTSMCHADELQFFFPFRAFPYIGLDHPYGNFSQMVVKFWVNFATTGVPTTENDTIIWNPVTDDHPYQYFELNEIPKMVESGLDDRIQFWNQFNLTELYM